MENVVNMDITDERKLRSKHDGDTNKERFDFDKDEYDLDVKKQRKINARVSTSNIKKIYEKSKAQSMHDEVSSKRKQIMNMALQIKENHITLPEKSIYAKSLLVEKSDFKHKHKKSVNLAFDEDDEGDDYYSSLTKDGSLSPSKRRNISISSLDPLSDDKYKLYHKKMFRQENRMIERDTSEAEYEADKLTLLLDKLEMLDWKVTLPKITIINNVDDEKEMEMKKEKTKLTIKNMLKRYESMKLRAALLSKASRRSVRIDPIKDWYKIYRKVDRKLLLDYHSSSDEDEENMDIEQIRSNRSEKRKKQCGGLIIIGLRVDNDASTYKSNFRKYELIAEPLKNPYVIKLTKDEKRIWKDKVDQVNKKFTYYKHFGKQTAIMKEKVIVVAGDSEAEYTSDIGTSKRISGLPNENESDNDSSSLSAVYDIDNDDEVTIAELFDDINKPNRGAESAINCSTPLKLTSSVKSINAGDSRDFILNQEQEVSHIGIKKEDPNFVDNSQESQLDNDLLPTRLSNDTIFTTTKYASHIPKSDITNDIIYNNVTVIHELQPRKKPK